jgi:hypothetical protein
VDPDDLDPSWRYYLTVVNLLPEGESWTRPSDEFVYEYSEPYVTDLISQDRNGQMVTSRGAQTTLNQEAYNEALATAGMAEEALAQQALLETAEGATELMNAWGSQQAEIWTALGDGSSLTSDDFNPAEWNISQGILEGFDASAGQYRGISGSIDSLKGELTILGTTLETYYAETDADVDAMAQPIKEDIEEIQWEMSVLDELWDQLIQGDPDQWRSRMLVEAQDNPDRQAYVTALIEDLDLGLLSYAEIEEDYQETYQGLSSSYQTLEDAKAGV